ncbi:MAG: PepSY-associated TM helix domain-containing protein [Telluria sp.]
MPVIPFRSPKTPPPPFTVQPPSAPSRRALAVKWLRKMHGWIGLWGAVLGLLFGGTGILLNHRAILKIPAVQVQESTVQIPLPNPAPPDPQALAAWLKSSLKLAPDPARVKAEPARAVAWGDRAVVQPARWSASFTSPSGAVQAEYWVGNSYVTLKRSDNNVFATLTNLHKGVGMSVGWILLVDTLAGSIILLSLSGMVLWVLTNRRRTVGIAIAAASLLLAGGVALASI